MAPEFGRAFWILSEEPARCRGLRGRILRVVWSAALRRSGLLWGRCGGGGASTGWHHFGLSDEGCAFADEKFRRLEVPDQLGLGLEFAAFSDHHVSRDASCDDHSAGVHVTLDNRFLANDHPALGFDFAFDLAFKSEGLTEGKSPFDFDVA